MQRICYSFLRRGPGFRCCTCWVVGGGGPLLMPMRGAIRTCKCTDYDLIPDSCILISEEEHKPTWLFCMFGGYCWTVGGLDCWIGGTLIGFIGTTPGGLDAYRVTLSQPRNRQSPPHYLKHKNSIYLVAGTRSRWLTTSSRLMTIWKQTSIVRHSEWATHVGNLLDDESTLELPL